MNKPNSSNKKIDIKKLMIIVGSALSFLLLVGAGVLIFVSSNLSRFKDVAPVTSGELVQESEEATASLPDLSEEELQKINAAGTETSLPKGIYHIMLYGLDTRQKDQFNGRSDVMLLVTMDTKNKSLKVTSFMRDILVPIPGHDYNRLNAAYAFGGPDLSTQVIAKQFGLNVSNYAVINFWTTASIIDLFNGIDIEIEKREIDAMNTNIKEMNKLDSSQKTQLVTKAGEQHLTGTQAVAYMRIRHVGTDFERTQRQRKVLLTMLKSLSNMSLDKVLQLLQLLPDYMRTNLSSDDMLSFAKTLYELRKSPIEQLRLPVDGSYKDVFYKKMEVLNVDFATNSDKLKEFLQINE